MKFFNILVITLAAVVTVCHGQSSQCFQTPAVQGTRCGGVFGSSGVVQAFTYRSGQCISFVYAGCGGNQNRFSTLAECQRLCSNSGTGGQTCAFNGQTCPFGQTCQFNRCVPSSTTGATCFTNAQCAAGQTCQNNRCTTRSTGPFCTTQAQCQFGQTCQANRCVTGSTGAFCTSQAMCPFGQTCQNNRCTTGTTTGTFCTTQGQCPFGQTCQNGRCTASSTGTFCTSAAQCTFGQTCQVFYPSKNHNFQNNRCTTGSTTGTFCTSQAQCIFGQTCQNNRCTTGSTTGTFCTTQSQCPFGQTCQFNRCTPSNTNTQCTLQNEFYTTCGSCERTCTNQNPTCTTGCQQGCRCRSGYVRNTLTRQCVLPQQCPNTGGGGTGTCSTLPTVDPRCTLSNQRRSPSTGCWSYTVFCP